MRGGAIVEGEEEAVVEEGEEVGHGRGVVQLRPQDLKHGACAERFVGLSFNQHIIHSTWYAYEITILPFCVNMNHIISLG